MKIGFIGLGKLGYPVACAMNSKGMEVYGYDPKRTSHDVPIEGEKGIDNFDTFEEWKAARCDMSRFHLTTLEEVVEKSELIFVAVQTPHEEQFDGTHVLTSKRADFNYTFLEAVLKDIFDIVRDKKVISIISTCLPGTTHRFVDRFGGKLDIVYNPYFIAMGTVVHDFFNPEFTLIGGASKSSRDILQQFYMRDMQLGYPYFMSLESAEVTKMGYNTLIGMKIAVINTLMEVCQKVPGANINEVSGALKLANKRIVSTAYMEGGMGDGGPCHPRDNIAMSWLAKELELSFDIFGVIMRCREEQTKWIADTAIHSAGDEGDIYILGSSYKPETDLVDGSAALLLMELLGTNRSMVLDKPTDRITVSREAAVYIVGCKNKEFRDYTFAQGSVVIDPFRYIPDQPGVKVIRIGEH